MYKQVTPFFGNIFQNINAVLKEVLSLLETWKNNVDQGKVFGALLTDHSKAFDTILHDLFPAKLQTYGCDSKSLELVQDYLSNQKQRTKVEQDFSA